MLQAIDNFGDTSDIIYIDANNPWGATPTNPTLLSVADDQFVDVVLNFLFP